MKTILVLTDFSPAAKNAAHYAGAMAKELKAKLVLFHAFALPLPSSEVPFVAVSVKELEKGSKTLLEKEAKALQKKFRVKTETIAQAGFAVQETLRLEKKMKPEFIIMGMKGASRTAKFFGSTVTDLLPKTITPLLVIPENSRFHAPEKILFACDFSEKLSPKTVFPLRAIAKKFKSDVYVVNVESNGTEKRLAEKADEGVTLEKQLPGINYIYYFPRYKSVVRGIDRFLEKHKAEMLVMIPHKHNLYERLFRRSVTRKMAFETKIPLLALPERHKKMPAYLI